MRHFTLFLILLSAISFAGNNKDKESKIKAVTVYLSGAQIEHTANIQLLIGTAEDHLISRYNKELYLITQNRTRGVTALVLNENVFLTADIENWEQYNLLPAEANVYFEGSYSGKTTINPQSTTEKLTISLGVDPNVVVKRTQPINFKKNAFLGSNKIGSKQYDIELKNNKSSDINLVLLDRIPISQNKEIKIDEVETGNATYDNKKGILKWKVNIPANDKSVYKFSYVIKYPKYKQVNL